MNETFLSAVADALDVEAIGPDDDFRAVEGWCSLKAFGLLVLMENDWHTPVSIDRFMVLRTPRDLWREVVAEQSIKEVRSGRDTESIDCAPNPFLSGKAV